MKMMFMKKSFILMVSLWLCFTQTNAQSIPRPNIPAPKGFSVNSFTGNVFYQRTDLTLRGTGFPLYSTFYYNTVQDTLDYGYGNGWSFYYNAFYKESNDTLIIQHSDAKKDTFRLVNSAYKSPVGIYDTLIKSGTVFILRSKDGMEHIFAQLLSLIPALTQPKYAILRAGAWCLTGKMIILPISATARFRLKNTATSTIATSFTV
jgi:hypothetical protein